MTAFLPGVDRAAVAGALSGRLRRAGVAVGMHGAASFARALAIADLADRTAVYWAARVTLVQRPEDLVTFDAVFAAVFGGDGLGLDPVARRRSAVPPPRRPDEAYVRVGAPASGEEAGGGLPWATPPSAVGPAEPGGDSAPAVPERLPTELEAAADTPFELLDPAQLALLDGWLADALRQWPARRSRRTAPHRHGRRVGLRPTVARARRTGFEPVELVRTRPVPRPRRVLLLCDVSRSMQPYAAAYLHLMRAAAVAVRAEAFAFATSLTRLTPVLTHASAERAVAQATAEVADRFGGTRIAGSLRSLLASRHGELCRGALVLIASDGWDSDPPEAMAAAMARLRRRAHRVLWLNPRLAAPGYEPLVGGMAAALPYCDAVLPADCVSALADVVAAMVDGARPGRRPLGRRGLTGAGATPP